MNRVAIAIDLGGTDIKGALLDREGRLHSPRRVPTGEDRSPAKVVDRLADLIDGLQKTAGGAAFGVGIGVPGGVYPDSKKISQAPNFPGWYDVDLVSPLMQKTGLPVAIDNDANVAGLGEFEFGAGKAVDSMVLITLGTGIGGGIILDGRIWRGQWGMAGEIGHITIEPEGVLCGCGNRGCIEAYASGPALVRQAKEALAREPGAPLLQLAGGDPDRITPKLIYDAAKQGCPVSRAVFEKASRYLGNMMASVLNLLNVPLFVIGGGVSASFDLLYEPMRDEIRRRAYRIPGENVAIQRAILGNDAGMIGAGMLAFAELTPAEGR
ncbi:MAG: ROK family glucokinase [Myxococcales bacterium]|nr:ROK family glucokinase [Myxococcales bacterium]